MMEMSMFEPMRKKNKLRDMSNKNIQDGFSRSDMYDVDPWCETPLDRDRVKARNRRKERDDGR